MSGNARAGRRAVAAGSSDEDRDAGLAIAKRAAFLCSACLFAQPLADCVRTRNPLPALFANLLPEDKLREAMEKHHAGSVRAGNDFDLLVALGSDLPGAVRVMPSDRAIAPLDNLPAPKPKARFSLAGFQMKLSVIKNTGKGGGLTLPLGDDQGSYIAKFPSTSFPGVWENEYANLALAEAIGMEVPERELVEQSEFEGIPKEFETLSDGKVLLVKRFDRSADGERIHIEDFAQAFGVYPSRKYEGAAYHDIAAALNVAVSSTAALEFVRRLALAAITGNGDMHLKNWSLIYREGGDKPHSRLSMTCSRRSLTSPRMPWLCRSLASAPSRR